MSKTAKQMEVIFKEQYPGDGEQYIVDFMMEAYYQTVNRLKTDLSEYFIKELYEYNTPGYFEEMVLKYIPDESLINAHYEMMQKYRRSLTPLGRHELAEEDMEIAMIYMRKAAKELFEANKI